MTVTRQGLLHTLLGARVGKLKKAIFAAPLAALLLFLAGCEEITPEQHFENAQSALANDEVRLASIELKNAIQKNPQFVDARALLGVTHFKVGDLPSAIKEFERAIDLGDTSKQTRLYLLRSKVNVGRYSEVVGELEESGSLEPEFAVVLGEAYLSARDLEKAKPMLAQGAHLVEGMFSLARVAHIENDVERALNYLERAVQTDPAYTEAWLYKGDLELTTDADAALASFTTGAGLLRGDVVGSMGIVRAHLVKEDLPAASASVDRLIARVDDFVPAQYLLGLIRYQEGRYDEAERALQIVQRGAPDHLPTLFLMGVVKARQGQTNQAADNLRRYIAQDQNNMSARKLLASIYAEDGQLNDVLELLEPIVEGHSDPQAYALLGAAYLRLGQMTEATQAMQKAVELAPDMAPFRNQLALSLLSSGEEDEGFAVLDSALELDGDQFESDYIRVMFYLQKRDFEAASQAVAQLVEKNPDVPIGHNLSGVLALATDDIETARTAFSKAIELDPAFYPATANLARIEEETGNTAGAETIFQTAMSAGSDDAAGLGYADFLVRQNRIDDALAELQRLVGAYPESIRARVGELRLLLATRKIDEATRSARALRDLAGDVPDVLLLSAETALAAGDTSAAQDAAGTLQTLLKQFEGNGGLHALVGGLQLRVGNLTLARSNLEKALALDSNLGGARLSLARLDLIEGNLSGARAQLNTLTEAGQSNEEIELMKGDVMLAGRDLEGATEHFKTMAQNGSRVGTIRYAIALGDSSEYTQAEEVLDNWLADNPGDTGVQLALANVGIQKGDHGQARARYEAMLPSDNPILLNNLAWIYMEEGNPEAETMARRAMAVLPDNPDIADTLGWILVQSGSTQEGLGFLRTSVRAKPQDPTVQYHYAVGLDKAGDTSGAIEALRKALSTAQPFQGRDEAEALLNRLTS